MGGRATVNYELVRYNARGDDGGSKWGGKSKSKVDNACGGEGGSRQDELIKSCSPKDFI
jgi:hypothetical protein